MAFEFWLFSCFMTYPSDDGCVAHVLVDQYLELSHEIGLFCHIRGRNTWGHTRHVLYDHKSQTVRGIVKQIGLDLDLHRS